jgi:hypothetical protein
MLHIKYAEQLNNQNIYDHIHSAINENNYNLHNILLQTRQRKHSWPHVLKKNTILNDRENMQHKWWITRVSSLSTFGFNFCKFSIEIIPLHIAKQLLCALIK